MDSRAGDRDILPPRPSAVCATCWRGPFAAHLGIFHLPVSLRHVRGEESCYEGGYTYSTSRSRVKCAAAGGCAWCKLLRVQILARERNQHFIHRAELRSPGQARVRVGLREVYGTPADTLAIEVLWNNAFLFEAVVQTSADDPAAPYVVARHPVLDVGSPRALDLAKILVEECVHGHEKCAAIAPPADVRLPTRLVDCGDPVRPRLVFTEGTRGRYLALSYVWGEPQPHRTTTSNISTHTHGIDAALLPQSIRDAICVTHALGLRYLWVDSLCIVQDSDEDKVHEIGYMHLIYRYAYLTIIAACARTVGEGFLQKRPEEAVIRVALPFRCPQRRPADGSLALLQVGEVLVSLTEVSSGPVRTGEPVDGRGWCLQEFAMSPRKLIFTSKTLLYRCQKVSRHIGNSFHNHMGRNSPLPNILFRSPPPRVPQESKEWSSVHTVWCELVAEYTGRTLGRSLDKLVACGALAEAFHSVLRTDYLAGLWRRTLLGDLLWYRSDDGLRRSSEFRAPSWSWAAIDGEVSMHWLTFPRPEATAMADVVRCDIVLKNAELPFGEVTGGSLVLRAALIRCEARIRGAEQWGDDILLPSGWCKRYSGDSASASANESQYASQDVRPPGWFQLDRYTDAQDEAATARECYLVPLIRRVPSQPDDRRASDAQGIIVSPIEAHPSSSGIANIGTRVYRRIGAFRADSWDTVWQADYESLTSEEIEII